jgi:hypothetical protein
MTNYKIIKVATKSNSFMDQYTNNHSEGYSVWTLKLKFDDGFKYPNYDVVSIELYKVNQNENELHPVYLKNAKWLQDNNIKY